jgi:hypothetical protein
MFKIVVLTSVMDNAKRMHTKKCNDFQLPMQVLYLTLDFLFPKMCNCDYEAQKQEHLPSFSNK